MCDDDTSFHENTILKTLPFVIFKKDYPIMHILAGDFCEVFVHIFSKDEFITVFQDHQDELDMYHFDSIENYIATFIQMHYDFVLKNAVDFSCISENDGNQESFGLMRFFDISE